MYINFSLVAGALLFAIFPARGQAPACKDFKMGIFHAYPRNTGSHFIIYREGDIEKDIDLTHKDTSLWKIEWDGDCTYIETYLSGNTKMSGEMADFLKKHSLVYNISSVTKDYYTYSEHIDKVSGTLLETDTAWVGEKTSSSDNVALFQQIQNSQLLRKRHFSDTSKYAVLYIYRPGKLTNSLAGFEVYLEDDLISVMKNRSGFIFAIRKEGHFTLTSRLDKDVCPLPVDIHFGKKYFIRSSIKWGFYHMRNYKLEMALVGETEGQADFDAVQ